MGKRRTPTKVLEMRGSRVALGRTDAHLAIDPPDRPDWLSPEAAAEWDRILPGLVAEGIPLQPVDEWELGRLCVMLEMRRRVAAQLDADGWTIEKRVKSTGAVKVVAHPLVATLGQLDNLILGLEREFGMTPASRSKLLGHT